MSKIRSRKAVAEEEAAIRSHEFAEKMGKGLPEQPIGRAMSLVEAEKREEVTKTKRALLNRDDPKNIERAAAEELKAASDEMHKAWCDLKNALPPDHQNPETGSKLTAFNMLPRESTSQDGDKKAPAIERVKKLCVDVCDTLDRYSDLFKFIPSEDKYVTLITGTVTTIVQATVRHRRIGDGFADAVDKIRLALIYCSRIQNLCRTGDKTDQEMLQATVADLLTVIFNFLTPYTRWCRSRFERFKSSLQKDFYERNVTAAVSDLEQLMRRLNQEMNIRTNKDGQENLRISREIRYLQRQQCQEYSDLNTRVGEMKETLESFRQLGENAMNLTKVLAEKQASDERYKELEKFKAKLRAKEVTLRWQEATQKATSKLSSTTANLKAVRKLLWHEIETASSHLEVVASNGYPIDLPDAESLRASPLIFQRLHDWMTVDGSQWLWLRGPAMHDQLSEVSVAAFYIFMVSERLKLPLLAYRFQADELGLSDSSESAGFESRSLAMDRFTLMVYSVIRQLVCLLPKEIHTDAQFTLERFCGLDASTSSLLDAFNIIEELLSLVPELLICIFDGFQFVDNDMEVDGSYGYIDLFLAILRQAGTKKKLKVLICSDGHCRSLLDDENMGMDEQMHLDGDTGPGEQMFDFFDLLIEDISQE